MPFRYSDTLPAMPIRVPSNRETVTRCLLMSKSGCGRKPKFYEKVAVRSRIFTIGRWAQTAKKNAQSWLNQTSLPAPLPEEATCFRDEKTNYEPHGMANPANQNVQRDLL